MHIKGRIIFESEPAIDNMQDVQKLTLVFVYSLYLHIKYGIGINGETGELFGDLCKAYLILFLNSVELILEASILSEMLYFLKFAEILYPP